MHSHYHGFDATAFKPQETKLFILLVAFLKSLLGCCSILRKLNFYFFLVNLQLISLVLQLLNETCYQKRHFIFELLFNYLNGGNTRTTVTFWARKYRVNQKLLKLSGKAKISQKMVKMLSSIVYENPLGMTFSKKKPQLCICCQQFWHYNNSNWCFL